MNKDDINDDTGSVTAILAAGASLGEPKDPTNKEYRSYAVVPLGHELKPLARRERPDRKSGSVQMKDAKSFANFYAQFRINDQSNIYASMSPAQFVGVLNDHEPENGPAGWRDHRVVFQPAHSLQWKEWMKRNGPGQAFAGNVEFAEWLEDQAIDVTQPGGANMLQMALTFKATESAKFSNAVNLQDGSITFDYQRLVDGSATTQAGGKSKIPERFTIQIPVFDGMEEPKYKIEARFRYRLVSGGLKIWYQLERPHLVMEAAFKDLWKKIEKDTDSAILYGLPD